MPLQTRLKSNAAAPTSADIDDNTGATASDGLAEIDGSGDDAAININFATLAAEYNALRADFLELRSKFND